MMLDNWVVRTLEKEYALRILSALDGHISMNLLELVDQINGDYKTTLHRIKEMESVGLVEVYKLPSHKQTRVGATYLGKKIIRGLLDGVEGW